ncbi:hypothetical protein BGZ59_000374, partial [Podila verticillata]
MWSGTSLVAPDSPEPGQCIPHHNDFELALALFILVGMVVSYLPQHFRIIHKGTSEGISPWFLLLGCISASSTFLNIVILQWKVIKCCGVLNLGPCLESTLGIAQLGVQFVMFGLVFVLYIIYFPAYKKLAEAVHDNNPNARFLPGQSAEWSLSLAIARIVLGHLVICVLVTIYVLTFVGPENKWTLAWASFLGITSVILATIQYVPQILRTWHRKSVGALSIPMMMMQTPGAALLTLSLALRPGANWTTWIVYAVTGCLQGTLLIMCIYYHFRAKALGYDSFDSAETDPLIAEGEEVRPLFGFHFSASAAIDRFMTLHHRSDHQQPSSTSATNSETTRSRKGKAKSVPTTIKDTNTHHPYKVKGKSDRKNTLPPDLALSRTEKAQEQARQELHPQPYQPPPPNSSERHRYIASGYLLQNTGLVRALRDRTCAHTDLVERDFAYLR